MWAGAPGAGCHVAVPVPCSAVEFSQTAQHSCTIFKTRGPDRDDHEDAREDPLESVSDLPALRELGGIAFRRPHKGGPVDYSEAGQPLGPGGGGIHHSQLDCLVGRAKTGLIIVTNWLKGKSARTHLRSRFEFDEPYFT